MEIDGTEYDGSQDVNILCVQVIPCLAIAIKCSTAIDIHIMAAKLEERCGVLECLIESILLPVISVVGELDRTLDIYSIVSHMSGKA